MDILNRILAWLAARPPHTKVLLSLACTVLVIELGFRSLAPKSAAYAAWTRGVERIGELWSAVLLSLIYVLSVGPIGIIMRAIGHDPLDRTLAPEPSFWRAHEPNPLGPVPAARHQF